MQGIRKYRRAWRIERTIALVIIPLVLFVLTWTAVSHATTKVPVEPRHSVIPSPGPLDLATDTPNTPPASQTTDDSVQATLPSTRNTTGVIVNKIDRSTAAYQVPEPKDAATACMANAAKAAAMGSLGVASAMAFSTLGAAYGMAKSSAGVLHLVKLAPAVALRGMIPVVMAELLAIYGFISSLNIAKNLDISQYSSWAGYLDFASGLVVGLSGLAAGMAIGTIGEANVRSYGVLLRKSQHQPKSKPMSPDRGSPISPAMDSGGDGAQEYQAASGRLFSAMVITMIFAEGIGLYGMIVGMLLNGNAAGSMCSTTYRWEKPRVKAVQWDWFAYCPATATSLFGGLGATMSTAGSIAGAAYGIAKSGTGVAHLGVRQPARLFRGTTPVIMSELLAVYGFVNSLIIALSIEASKYSLFAGILDLAAGATVGLGCLASGMAIGTVGDACVRAYGKQERIFVAMVLILIFAEALGLFSLIVGLLLHNTGSKAPFTCG